MSLIIEKRINDHGQYEYGFVDGDDHWVIEPRFVSVRPFENGLAFVEADNCLWGVIDTCGKWVVEPTFGHLMDFSEDLCAASLPHDIEEPRKCGYINKRGEWVIPPRFYRACPFEEGRAKVMETVGGDWRYIDRSGNYI